MLVKKIATVSGRAVFFTFYLINNYKKIFIKKRKKNVALRESTINGLEMVSRLIIPIDNAVSIFQKMDFCASFKSTCHLHYWYASSVLLPLDYRSLF